MAKPVSPETRQRMSCAHRSRHLTIKQERFIKAYAQPGNGFRGRTTGWLPDSPVLVSDRCRREPTETCSQTALKRELARIELEVSPERVQRRLDEISHEAQADGQYGPAVRAEELLGKSIGMWVDQSVNINVSSEHVQALLNQARQRQLEPIDNSDDSQTKSTDSDDE